MHAAMYDRGLFADILHHIDFAACRPSGFFDIITHHPEGWPHPLALGYLDASLEAPIFLLKQACRLHPGGSVIASDAIRAGIFLFAGDYSELAILHVHILSSIRVGFQFVIAPSGAASLHDPLGRVGQRAVCSVKFVAPSEYISRWWSRSLRRSSPAHAGKQDHDDPARAP